MSQIHQVYVLNADHPGRAQVLANAHAFLDRLPKDKDWRIEVDREVKRRTDKQRNSLFGVAYKTIMESVGLRGSREKQELHTNLCGEYFGWRNDPFRGRVPVRTTTTNEQGERDEISVERALDMYAFIQQRMAEYGIDVPNPDPMWAQKARWAA